MATTWKVFDTKSQKESGLITEITFGCTAQEGICIDRVIKTTTLTGDSNAEGFIPYLSLTPETVLDWAKNSLEAGEVASIETTLQANVTAQQAAKNAETVISGLPWA